MKIGIVSNLYPPYVRGGAEHVVVRTVEALTARNHDVFVFTTKPDDGKNDLELGLNSTERIYRFYPKNFYYVLDDFKHKWLTRLFWHIRDALCPLRKRRMREVLDRERPDIMITHNLKGIGLRIPRVIQFRGIPHIHVVHDLQLIYPSGLLFAGEEKKLWFERVAYCVYQRVCKILFGTPDKVVFPSEYLRNEYQKRGFFKKSEVVVMPNPAPDFDAVLKQARRAGRLRLLFVGQLETHKGIHLLLDTFRSLSIDAKLIIAGEGTERERVERMADADKRITYLGYIGMDQLVQCLEHADALVAPSLCYENSPTVIYEALQSGVPVLAADIGGVGELVEDGVNGFLFAPNDADALIDAIHVMNEKKEEFALRQSKTRGTVRAYALSAYADELISQCRQIIQRRKSE
jgi:glycosyltransferase involved in cell wall biosynthesis